MGALLPELRRLGYAGAALLFGGRRQAPLEQKLAESGCELSQEARDFVEPPTRLSRRGQVAPAIHFDLERVNAVVRRAVAIENMAAGKRVVRSGNEPGLGRHGQCFGHQPRRGAATETVAEDDLRRPL